jgi:LysM repeat protein
MTLPSQSPRSGSPSKSPAKPKGGTRSLFLAIAAIGLGGAAAGWFLTHRSESPDASSASAESAGIQDPLLADQAAASTAIEETVALDAQAASADLPAQPAGTATAGSTTTTAPEAALGSASTSSVAAAGQSIAASATSGIAGTPGTAATTPAAGIGTPAQRLQQAIGMVDTDAVRARAELTRLLDSGSLDPAQRAQAYGAVNRLAERLLFSAKIVPGDVASQSYVVKKGDSLARIASREKLGVDWRFIQRINGLKTEKAIRPDQRLKLAHGPFDAEVVKADFRMNVYAGTGADRVMVASFPCGLGENDSTPVGTFRVRKGSKLIDPAWVNPRTGEKFASNDPKNPIGERWIGLEGTTPEMSKFTGYGIHGTVEPQSIGKQMSMGCVRLGDAEVQVVYELIGEQSTVVIR